MSETPNYNALIETSVISDSMKPIESIDTAAALSPAERQAKITEMLTAPFNGANPDAIFSFSGGIKYDSNSGKYRTLAYSELSEHGLVTGSKTRVIATAEIAKVLPEVTIVTNSFNRFDSEEPTMASVIHQELVNRGVSPERLDSEELSFSTLTQIKEMVIKAVDQNWTKLIAVTNTYHLPRIREMNRQLDVIIDDEVFQAALKIFKERGGKVEYIGSEDIIRLVSSHYKKYLDEAEKTQGFTTTVAAEAQGLSDLQAGKYRTKFTPESPRN